MCTIGEEKKLQRDRTQNEYGKNGISQHQFMSKTAYVYAQLHFPSSQIISQIACCKARCRTHTISTHGGHYSADEWALWKALIPSFLGKPKADPGCPLFVGLGIHWALDPKQLSRHPLPSLLVNKQGERPCLNQPYHTYAGCSPCIPRTFTSVSQYEVKANDPKSLSALPLNALRSLVDVPPDDGGGPGDSDDSHFSGVYTRSGE